MNHKKHHKHAYSRKFSLSSKRETCTYVRGKMMSCFCFKSWVAKKFFFFKKKGLCYTIMCLRPCLAHGTGTTVLMVCSLPVLKTDLLLLRTLPASSKRIILNSGLQIAWPEVASPTLRRLFACMHAWKSASMPIYQKLKQMLPWRRTLPTFKGRWETKWNVRKQGSFPMALHGKGRVWSM